MIPTRRILYSIVCFIGAGLSTPSSLAQILSDGEIEVRGSATDNRDSVREVEVAEEVYVGPNYADSVMLSLSGEQLQGGFVNGSDPYQFTPQAQGKVSFEDQIFTLSASASVQLSSDARYNLLQQGDQIPRSEADLSNFFLSDGIKLYSSDPSHWGQQVLVDLSFDLTAELSSSLENTAQDGSIASANYSTHTTFGLEQREVANGEYLSKLEGDFNLSEPTIVTREGYPMRIAENLSPQVGSNLAVIDIRVRTVAQVAGDSGGSASAEATVTLRNARLANVRLASDSTLIPHALLTSVSQSGHDWLGNGEPVIELDEFSWDNTAGGMFGTDTNWDPVGIPGSDNLAKINLPATYTINVGNQEVKRLEIGGDPSFNVSFTNADLTVGATSLEPPGVDIDNGNFTLEGGTVRSAHARIGKAALTNATIEGAGATWQNTGRLTVGEGGESLLLLRENGKLTAGETWVGDSSNSSESFLISEGAGTLAEIGNAQIGISSTAHLSARNGGTINGGLVRLGTGPAGTGNLTVTGDGPSVLETSDVELGTLVAGYGGEGTVIVEAGSLLVVDVSVVGQLSNGSATVSGPGSEWTSKTLLSVGGNDGTGESIVNSPSANGELVINDGGKVAVGPVDPEDNFISLGMSIGKVGQGSVSVNGDTGDSRAVLEVREGLRVGVQGGREAPEFDGTLDVVGGALLSVDNLTIAVDQGASGSVLVSGENTTRGDVSELNVSENVEVGGYYFLPPAEGKGELVAENGASVAISGILDIGTSNPGSLSVQGFRPSNVDTPARVTAFAVQVGRGNTGEVSVETGGQLITETIALALPYNVFENETPTASMDILDGGQVEVYALGLNPGHNDNATASLIVEGWSNLISSTLEADSIQVGPNSEIQVLDKGRIETNTLTIEGGGKVFVEGGIPVRRSRILVRDSLTLGGVIGTESFLGIDVDALVEVEGSISFTSGARMCIDGELRTDHVFAAGFLELGCSLGVALIDGDFTLGPTGVMEIEISGTTPMTDHDVMMVTGDVDLQGTIHFVFTNYAPKQGETFAVFENAGNFSDMGSSVIYTGLKEGFETRFETVDGIMSLVAESDAELLDTDDPVTYNTTLLGEKGRASFSLFGETGYRYLFEFSADLETWVVLEEVDGSEAVLYFDHGGSGSDRQFYRVRREAL